MGVPGYIPEYDQKLRGLIPGWVPMSIPGIAYTITGYILWEYPATYPSVTKTTGFDIWVGTHEYTRCRIYSTIIGCILWEYPATHPSVTKTTRFVATVPM